MSSPARSVTRCAVLALVTAPALQVLPAGLAAQSAEEILTTALERHEQRMEGIDHYTVVQEAMGFETTVRFERSEIDGHTVFLPADQGAAQAPVGGFYGAYPRMVDRAELRGKETLEGRECWVVGVDDLGDLDLGREMTLGDRGDFEPRTVTLYLDTGDYVPRRVRMEGEMTDDGETRPFTAEISLADYRNVEGMLHPFEMRILAEGALPGMSEQEVEEARASLEEMEEQLEEMDDSQRDMVERMMGPRMERLRTMLASGRFELTATTKEVRVNQ